MEPWRRQLPVEVEWTQRTREKIVLIFILVQETMKICPRVSFVDRAVAFMKCAHYAPVPVLIWNIKNCMVPRSPVSFINGFIMCVIVAQWPHRGPWPAGLHQCLHCQPETAVPAAAGGRRHAVVLWGWKCSRSALITELNTKCDK